MTSFRRSNKTHKPNLNNQYCNDASENNWQEDGAYSSAHNDVRHNISANSRRPNHGSFENFGNDINLTSNDLNSDPQEPTAYQNLPIVSNRRSEYSNLTFSNNRNGIAHASHTNSHGVRDANRLYNEHLQTANNNVAKEGQNTNAIAINDNLFRMDNVPNTRSCHVYSANSMRAERNNATSALQSMNQNNIYDHRQKMRSGNDRQTPNDPNQRKPISYQSDQTKRNAAASSKTKHGMGKQLRNLSSEDSNHDYNQVLNSCQDLNLNSNNQDSSTTANNQFTAVNENTRIHDDYLTAQSLPKVNKQYVPADLESQQKNPFYKHGISNDSRAYTNRSNQRGPNVSMSVRDNYEASTDTACLHHDSSGQIHISAENNDENIISTDKRSSERVLRENNNYEFPEPRSNTQANTKQLNQAVVNEPLQPFGNSHNFSPVQHVNSNANGQHSPPKRENCSPHKFNRPTNVNTNKDVLARNELLEDLQRRANSITRNAEQPLERQDENIHDRATVSTCMNNIPPIIRHSRAHYQTIPVWYPYVCTCPSSDVATICSLSSCEDNYDRAFSQCNYNCPVQPFRYSAVPYRYHYLYGVPVFEGNYQVMEPPMVTYQQPQEHTQTENSLQLSTVPNEQALNAPRQMENRNNYLLNLNASIPYPVTAASRPVLNDCPYNYSDSTIRDPHNGSISTFGQHIYNMRPLRIPLGSRRRPETNPTHGSSDVAHYATSMAHRQNNAEDQLPAPSNENADFDVMQRIIENMVEGGICNILNERHRKIINAQKWLYKYYTEKYTNLELEKIEKFKNTWQSMFVECTSKTTDIPIEQQDALVPISGVSKTDGEVICVICFDHISEQQEYTQLECSHEYHTDCLRKWWHKCLQCPICRRHYKHNLLKSYYRKLYGGYFDKIEYMKHTFTEWINDYFEKVEPSETS